jgi:uncharacterized phage-like protein YoqJ
MAEETNVIESLKDLKALLPPGKALCFTGHRPKALCGYDANKYRDFVAWLTNTLYHQFYVKEGVRTFISGGAQGIDQLAFWAVEQMKRVYDIPDIKNVVFAVKGQSTCWAEKGAFSISEYNMMLRRADYVCYVSGGSIAALFDRNHLMCDNADVVLGVYYDNTWTTAKGGTSECLRYAVNHENKKQVYRISYELQNKQLVPTGVIDCHAEHDPIEFV